MQDQAKKEIAPGFDLMVHHRDSKTGRTVKVNPYRLFNSKGKDYFERPKGSGNLYYGNGEPAGQRVDGKIKVGMEHIAWTPPLTGDQRVAEKYTALESENALLTAEIAEIKRERKFAQVKPQIAKSPVSKK